MKLGNILVLLLIVYGVTGL